MYRQMCVVMSLVFSLSGLLYFLNSEQMTYKQVLQQSSSWSWSGLKEVSSLQCKVEKEYQIIKTHSCTWRHLCNGDQAQNRDKNKYSMHGNWKASAKCSNMNICYLYSIQHSFSCQGPVYPSVASERPICLSNNLHVKFLLSFLLWLSNW